MDGPGFHVGGLCPTWALSTAAGPRLARTRAPVGAVKVSRILRRHQLGRSLADTTRCPVGSWARPQPVPYTIAQEAIEVMICDFTLSMTSTFISLTELAHRAPEIVPDLAWVSVGRIPKGLTFTLVATGDRGPRRDPIPCRRPRARAEGPCEAGTYSNEVREFNRDDVLDGGGMAPVR